MTHAATSNRPTERWHAFAKLSRGLLLVVMPAIVLCWSGCASSRQMQTQSEEVQTVRRLKLTFIPPDRQLESLPDNLILTSATTPLSALAMAPGHIDSLSQVPMPLKALHSLEPFKSILLEEIVVTTRRDSTSIAHHHEVLAAPDSWSPSWSTLLHTFVIGVVAALLATRRS